MVVIRFLEQLLICHIGKTRRTRPLGSVCHNHGLQVAHIMGIIYMCAFKTGTSKTENCDIAKGNNR